jgi:hypothetical protein
LPSSSSNARAVAPVICTIQAIAAAIRSSALRQSARVAEERRGGGNREPPGDDLDEALPLDVGPVRVQRGPAERKPRVELGTGELGRGRPAVTVRGGDDRRELH